MLKALLLCTKLITVSSVSDELYFQQLSNAAVDQTKYEVTYDPAYYSIGYPNGDVSPDIGVCTDVIIRAYRKMGCDLQQLVHEDMIKARAEYNKRRATKVLDTNIDHRRTPNMETYFTRHGKKLSNSGQDVDYHTGDIVFWDIAAGHVGLVVEERVPGTQRHYVVHNICCGVNKEDFLFAAKITGHYRYRPAD